jgi:hypothetical protein
MKRALLISAVLLVSFSALRAQDHGAATRPEPPPPKSITYTSPEGRYVVTLSQQPTLTSQNITAASGDNLMQYMASAPIGVGLAMIGYFDYPNTVVFSLDEARNGMVKSLNGTLMGEEAISLGGSPGRALRIAARTDSGSEFVDRARFYDVNRRIYVLQCLTPKANDNDSTAQTCEQFFDSFRVKTSQY